MSRTTRNKSAAPGKKSRPLLTGVLLGMMFGVALAAGVAWYMLKSPSPFLNKDAALAPEQVAVTKPAAVVVAPKPEPVVKAVPAAPAAEEATPRFEFYKVLTDKQDAAVSPKTVEKPNPADSKPAPAFQTTYLQAGSFTNAAEADNLKASLAMKGVESSVQTVTIPGKGVWHRVKVGPFQSQKEMDKIRGTLKLNGLDATPTH